jgi:hypothetical protein
MKFIGKARTFRQEVRAADLAFARALDIICRPLRARLARHPKLRLEMLPDLARSYDELIPRAFRVGRIEGTDDADGSRSRIAGI